MVLAPFLFGLALKLKGRALARPSERSERFEPLVRLYSYFRWIFSVALSAILCEPNIAVQKNLLPALRKASQ